MAVKPVRPRRRFGRREVPLLVLQFAAAGVLATFAAITVAGTSAFVCSGRWASRRMPSRSGAAGRVAASALSLDEVQAPSEAADDSDEGPGRGIGFIHDAIGEYALPKPYFYSPDSAAQLYRALGVNVRSSEEVDEDGIRQHMFAPQHPSLYRPFGPMEDASLLDMEGQQIPHDRNPGIRVERDFLSEEEEEAVLKELRELANSHGYDFVAPGEQGEAMSARITGRDEKSSDLPLAPWRWGLDFDKAKVPPALRQVIGKIESLKGYPLGPIRDVTVNIRQTMDYQMVPHIDPPGDGPNSFVLSLASGAVVTWSPVRALRENIERVNDDDVVVMDSYTDEDIDCLVPRRSMYHFSGNARYLWTHAVRPPASRKSDDGELETYERFGTWDKVLRRREHRAAIIFTFADPPVQAAPKVGN